MADEQDDSQQTEQPTQKRLDQAREAGDVIKSMEVSTFVVLAGGTLAIAMFGHSVAVGIAQILMQFIQEPDRMAVDGAGLTSLMRGTLLHLVIVLAPFMGVMLVASLAGHVLQSRPTFNLGKLAPDLSKLSLLSGLSRMFGLEGWINLVKGLIK